MTRAASSDPTPGGGSVAALSGALGAAMTAMVANLSQGKKYQDLASQMQAIVVRAEAAILAFEALMAEDQAVFTRYMQALKLPKEPEAAAQERTLALREAAEAAAEVPLRLAEQCVDMLSAAATIAKVANRHAISDLGVAAAMLQAAVTASLLTVDINLSGLDAHPGKSDLTTRRNRVEQEAATYTERILKDVRDRL